MIGKRKYDREFKLNAVKLYQNGKKLKAEVSRDLGIPESTFVKWIKAVEVEGEGKAFPGEGKINASNEELYYLKRELSEVKQERDILKKALAIFSQKPVRRSDIG
jgi:transposase-like protein